MTILNSLSATVNSYDSRKGQIKVASAEIASCGVTNFQTFFPEAILEPRAQFRTLFFPTHFLSPTMLFLSGLLRQFQVVNAVRSYLAVATAPRLLQTQKYYRSYYTTWCTRFRSLSFFKLTLVLCFPFETTSAYEIFGISGNHLEL